MMTESNLKAGVWRQVVLFSFPVLMLLAVGKDLLHSFARGYHFYLSEAMLFESFWLLFVPMVLVMRKMLSKRPPYVSIVFAPLLLSILHICIFSLLVFSISALFFSHTFGAVRIFIETLADYGMACLLLYGAAGFIFNRLGKRAGTVKEKVDKIRVAHQNKTLILPCSKILYVRSERPYIALVTPERTYLHNTTLQGFLDYNLSERFIRIHKSTVVNENAISSYTSRKNGDYDVEMINGDIIRASRNYSSRLKQTS